MLAQLTYTNQAHTRPIIKGSYVSTRKSSSSSSSTTTTTTTSSSSSSTTSSSSSTYFAIHAGCLPGGHAAHNAREGVMNGRGRGHTDGVFICKERLSDCCHHALQR